MNFRPCKSFFIRSTGLSHSLLCKNEGKCVITKEKRDCNACRYRKCIEAGMKIRCEFLEEINRPSMGNKYYIRGLAVLIGTPLDITVHSPIF